MKRRVEEVPQYTPDARCARCGLVTPLVLKPPRLNKPREHKMPPGWSTVYLLHAAKGLLEFCPECSPIIVNLLNEKHPATNAAEAL